MDENDFSSLIDNDDDLEAAIDATDESDHSDLADLDEMMRQSIRQGREYFERCPKDFKKVAIRLYNSHGWTLSSEHFDVPIHKVLYKELSDEIDRDMGHSGASYSYALSNVLGMDRWSPPSLAY